MRQLINGYGLTAYISVCRRIMQLRQPWPRSRGLEADGTASYRVD